MRAEKKQKLIERKATAIECVEAMGHFVFLVDDCPSKVRDAWRVLHEYVVKFEVDD